eukprot:77746_1
MMAAGSPVNYVSMEILTSNTVIKTDSVANTLSQQFQWLSFIVLYTPMWCTHSPSGTTRWYAINMLMTFITISVVLTFTSLVLFAMFEHYSVIADDPSWTVPASYDIAWIILLSSIRLLCIYYFYKHFNFPWNVREPPFLVNDNQSINIKRVSSVIKCTSTRIKVFLVTVIVMDIIYIVNGRWYVYCNGDTSYKIIILTTRFLVFDPSFIAVAVSSVIFLKYKLYLMLLINRLGNDNNINFNDMLHHYDSLIHHFKNECNCALHAFLQLFVIELICDAWTCAEDLDKETLIADIVDITRNVLLIIEISIGILSLSDAFESFNNIVSIYGKKHSMNNKEDYNYFLYYCFRYPLRIKVFGVEMSRNGIVTSVVVFVIAKWISYSVYSLYS